MKKKKERRPPLVVSTGAKRLAIRGWLAGYEVIERAVCYPLSRYDSERLCRLVEDHKHAKCKQCSLKARHLCWHADVIARLRGLNSKAECYTVNVRHMRSRQEESISNNAIPCGAERIALLLTMARALRAKINTVVENDTVFRFRKSHWDPIEEIPIKKIKELDVKLRLLRHTFGPIGPEPHVGLELECGVPNLRKLNEELAKAGLAIKAEVVSDGSVHFDELSSCEVRLCFRRRELVDVMTRAGAALRSAGAQVNKTCGLHVHIDCRNRDGGQVFTRLVRSLKWLYAVVAPSRRTVPAQGNYGGYYCRRNKSASMRHRTRYQAINGHAYSAHQTIEVRLHQGTVDENKIIQWVRLLLAIADGPDLKRVPSDLYNFAAKYRLPLDLVDYLARRAAELGGAEEEGLTVPELALAAE